MLPAALFILFLAIVFVLSRATHEGSDKILAAAVSDIQKAHHLLSADPHPTAVTKRAIAFLERWI